MGWREGGGREGRRGRGGGEEMEVEGRGGEIGGRKGRRDRGREGEGEGEGDTNLNNKLPEPITPDMPPVPHSTSPSLLTQCPVTTRVTDHPCRVTRYF